MQSTGLAGKLAVGAALATLYAGAALAAVTADEAAKLGKELTAFGAIKAGNADGSIPPYTGGITAPANFTPGSGIYVDPYPTDKPLFRIDAGNVDKYADKLNEGQIYLIKNYKGYYIDIYPTRRSIRFPDGILKATARNATTCTTQRDGLALDPACRGGIPFPIPKNGYEVMWNKLNYAGPPVKSTNRHYMVDANGSPVMTAELQTYSERSFYIEGRDPGLQSQLIGKTTNPSRKAGEANGRIDYLDPIGSPRRAWSYTPGQRRVRMAPEFSYDTPVSTTGGVMLYDETFIFDGAMDRFDFKLAGKKEMYIPSNNYALFNPKNTCGSGGELGPKTINPACERTELHRVWVIDATLKPGMRHTYSRRIYYFDEDNFLAGGSVSYDQSGKLYRTANQYSIALYDIGSVYPGRFAIYDFVKGNYSIQSQPVDGFFPVDPMPAREMAPEAVAGTASR